MKKLRIDCYTKICKPLNGSVKKTSPMLLLDTISYKKKRKDGTTTNENSRAYHLKGLKGWIRHKYMSYYKNKGVEVCYPTSKEKYEDGRNVIPQGFHALGKCNGECSIYKIFGGVIAIKDVNAELSRKSRIRIWSPPLVEDKGKYADGQDLNIVHLATDKMTAQGFNGEGLQDFNESYFSGDFHFYVDITDLNDDELTTMIDILLKENNGLGRGKTRDNGNVEIKQIRLFDGDIKRKFLPNGTIETIEDFKDITNELFEKYNQKFPSA